MAITIIIHSYNMSVTSAESYMTLCMIVQAIPVTVVVKNAKMVVDIIIIMTAKLSSQLNSLLLHICRHH